MNLVDNSTTTVAASTPGFWADLLYANTVSQAGVAVQMHVYAKCPSGSGTVRVLDSAGTTMLEVTGITAEGWYVVNGYLPPTEQKLDVYYFGDGTHECSVWTVQVDQFTHGDAPPVSPDDWVLLTPGSAPQETRGATFVLDTDRNVLIMFSGADGAQSLCRNKHWEWDGAAAAGVGNWTEILVTSQPSARHVYAACYDSSRLEMVMFSGYSIAGAASLTGTYTYPSAGTTWVAKSPATSPTVRHFSAMAFDSARAKGVLFGGKTDDGNYHNDTWEWNGAASAGVGNWTQITPTHAPSTRHAHTMAYDANRGVVVLFGGYATSGGQSQETWEYNGTDWTDVTPAGTKPSARWLHTAAYDPVRQCVIVFGGFDGTSPCHDTWSWNGTAWTQVTTADYPSARYALAMGYDPIHDAMHVFGGTPGTPVDDYELQR